MTRSKGADFLPGGINSLHVQSPVIQIGEILTTEITLPLFGSRLSTLAITTESQRGDHVIAFPDLTLYAGSIAPQNRLPKAAGRGFVRGSEIMTDLEASTPSKCVQRVTVFADGLANENTVVAQCRMRAISHDPKLNVSMRVVV